MLIFTSEFITNKGSTFSNLVLIQDLKKQTALRLAQEQQKKGRKNSPDQVPQNVEVEASVSQRYDPAAQESYFHSAQDVAGTSVVDTRAPYSHQTGTIPSQQQSLFRYPTENKDVASVSSYATDVSQARRKENHRSMPATLSSASFDGSLSQTKGTPKSKLPHGLTVHELKEMTKARLQAEAAEKLDNSGHNQVMHKEPFGPVPSNVRVPQDYRGQMLARPQSQNSPATPGFYGMRPSDHMARSVDARDAWETASVSTSASDFPASESVYSGMNPPDDLNPSVSFPRSGSYPNAGVPHYEWQQQ
jgi:hypothetical protein